MRVRVRPRRRPAAQVGYAPERTRRRTRVVRRRAALHCRSACRASRDAWIAIPASSLAGSGGVRHLARLMQGDCRGRTNGGPADGRTHEAGLRHLDNGVHFDRSRMLRGGRNGRHTPLGYRVKNQHINELVKMDKVVYCIVSAMIDKLIDEFF